MARRKVGVGIMPDEIHSPLGGSGVERFGNCPGAPALSALLTPDPDAALPEWTADGILAHTIIERCLSFGVDVWQLTDLEGVTPEIAVAATKAVDYFRSRPGRHFVELFIAHPAFHPKMFSRLDFAAVRMDQDRPCYIEIGDFKNGAGVRVEAKGNLQTRYYAFDFIFGQGWPADL